MQTRPNSKSIVNLQKSTLLSLILGSYSRNESFKQKGFYPS